MEKLAKILSMVFHPILGPIYGLSFMWAIGVFPLIGKNNASLILFAIMVLVNTFIIPVLTALLLTKMGKVDSIYMKDREQRTIPYFVTGLFYFFTFYFANSIGISPEFSAFMQGAALAVLGSLLINMKWKISAHMVGMGGALGMIIALYFYYPFIGFAPVATVAILAGVIGSVRLFLNAHKPSEVYFGFALGLISQLVVFNLI
ncbi:MAG: hypothetical protein ACJATA_000763 [Sphingobacteriales bacterium]|jgi:hypothetical protein